MTSASDNLTLPRWLAFLAWLTVAAVCPLLLLGALVTTMRVGMADQRAVVSPLQAIGEIVWGEQSLGWKIEHSHRLAGWFAGICGIALAGGFLLSARRGGVRWLGLLGLAMISVQGLLGIFRVALNAWWGPGLAWVHGSFAQIVFAVLVCVAMVASASWRHPSEPASARLRSWSLLGAALVFGQLVLGGLVRHHQNLLVARLHILGAFVVLAGLLLLLRIAWDEASFRPTLWLLLGLLSLQILLGVEAGMSWLGKYFNPSLAGQEPIGMLLVRTLHYFVGSLLFAATVVVALKAHRGFLHATRPVVSPGLGPNLVAGGAA